MCCFHRCVLSLHPRCGGIVKSALLPSSVNIPTPVGQFLFSAPPLRPDRQAGLPAHQAVDDREYYAVDHVDSRQLHEFP
jgi:hypothetical protein